MPDKRILIVEDETIVAMALEDSLEGMGYSVTGAASSAEEAIKLAGETRPDLILMDIRIQGEQDGIAAAVTINSLYNIPIVYLTAHSDDKTLERAVKTQPYGFLIKPFRARDLHSTIEIALYKHRLMKRKKEGNGNQDEVSVPVAPAPAHKAPPQKEGQLLPESFGKMILEEIDSPLFILNRDLCPVYFNAAFERFYWKMGYLTSKRDLAVFNFAPPSFLGTPAEYQEVFETGLISRTEKMITINHHMAIYSLVRMPLSDENAIRFVAVILRDVSQERGNEQKLREIHESYEKLQGQIGQIRKITQIAMDNEEPKMQKIAGLINEMIITIAEMDPRKLKNR